MAKDRARQTLERNREAATDYADRASGDLAREVLSKAEVDLAQRLRQAVRAGQEGTFTAGQIQSALVQVRAVLRDVKTGIVKKVTSSAVDAAELAAENAIEYMTDIDSTFRGTGTQPLAIDEAAVMDRAVSGAHSSALHRLLREGRPEQTEGIINRYGEATVLQFEKKLQQGLITKKPWAEVRSDLIGESPFLQGAPGYWAERIVRTETMAATNRADWEASRELDDQLGDVVKVLSATFDDRTYPDSYNVHGEIRLVDEPFEYIDYKGRSEEFMHPPNRPNDREIVVTHRLSWGPVPLYLRPKPTPSVVAAYAQRRMQFFGRPVLSTVSASKFR